jgi:hypothetical protein
MPPVTSPSHFAPGDIVVLRYVETEASVRMVQAIMGDPVGSPGQPPFLVDGKVVTVQARPHRVVVDSTDLVALYQPENTPVPRWSIAEQAYLPDTQRPPVEALRLLFPGKGYDVSLFFQPKGQAPWFYDALFEGEGLTQGWRERRKTNGTDQYATGKVWDPGAFRGWYANIDLPFRRMSYGFDIVDQTLDIVVRPDLTWYWKDEDEIEIAVNAGALSPDDEARIRIAGKEVAALIEGRKPPFDDSWVKFPIPDRSPITTFPDGWQTEPAQLAEWPVQ